MNFKILMTLLLFGILLSVSAVSAADMNVDTNDNVLGHYYPGTPGYNDISNQKNMPIIAFQDHTMDLETLEELMSKGAEL